MNTAIAACAFITFNTTVASVPQYDEYCQRNPSACQQYEASSDRVDLDQKTLNMLQSVNNQVNHSYKFRTDMEIYKTEEYWTMAGKQGGDCEDIALLKQRILEQKGIAKSNLILSVVYDENRQGHVVLLVRTNKGDYALDVKKDQVVLWSKLPYRYFMSQSPDDRNTWYTTEEQCDK